MRKRRERRNRKRMTMKRWGGKGQSEEEGYWIKKEERDEEGDEEN